MNKLMGNIRPSRPLLLPLVLRKVLPLLVPIDYFACLDHDTYSMDSTAKTWDIRPFAPTERHIRTFDGAPFGMEQNLIRGSWDKDGKKIAVGSGDGTVVIWASDTGKLLYKLPGHKGTVNCAEFTPGEEPVSKFIVSIRNL